MKKIGLLVVGVGWLICAGCMSFTVGGDGSNSRELNTPKTDKWHGEATVHGSYYGFKWADFDAPRGSVFRTDFRTNMLYSMAAVFSFGLYVPQTVEWWIPHRLESSSSTANSSRTATKSASGKNPMSKRGLH